MPYVPSEKTDGKSQDRNIIDAALEPLVHRVAGEITSNLSLINAYRRVFLAVARDLRFLLMYDQGVYDWSKPQDGSEFELAKAVYETGKKYDYEGAYLGEFNYAITRFIQRVPQIMVETKKWKDEFRYWLYAATVSALRYAEAHTEDLNIGSDLYIGLDGVFKDVIGEIKRRVNTAYEAAQIIKSGDCYDTPYYTRLVEVVDENGKIVGHQEIMLKRDESTLHKDVLDYELVLRKKPK